MLTEATLKNYVSERLPNAPGSLIFMTLKPVILTLKLALNLKHNIDPKGATFGSFADFSSNFVLGNCSRT